MQTLWIARTGFRDLHIVHIIHIDISLANRVQEDIQIIMESFFGDSFAVPYREANKTGIPLVLADTPAPETTKAVTTAATQKAPASASTSAATFDVSVIIAAVAAVAAAGVVVSKKRKQFPDNTIIPVNFTGILLYRTVCGSMPDRIAFAPTAERMEYLSPR